jgi:hypothetical protein
MNDGIKILLSVMGLAVVAILLGWAVLSFAIHMSTKEGSFVIIPETGQPFNVRKVTFVSNNTVAYEKTDGTGGRISGNFRVEDAISSILEKK